MGLPCINPPTAAQRPTRLDKDSNVVALVAHEGLLAYQSKGGNWKERWFVLDASQNCLVKCDASTRQRAKSYGSALGSSDGVRIADVSPVSLAPRVLDNAVSPPASQDAGLDVVTISGQRLRFLTKTADEERKWVAAINKLSHGFTRGVTERLADRELLADKYVLVRELGRGASGIVSLYTYHGKPYAVKKFVPQKAKGIPNRLAVPGAGASGARPGLSRPAANTGAQSEIPENVRREIALLKKASHLPFVIQLDDVIVNAEDHQYYLVMEYMGGGAIAEWDAERKCYACARNQKSLSLLDEKTVRAFLTNLLLGIQALHQNGLCHRDIKPENLMANEGRTMCKIGDLGIAHYFVQEANGELKEEANPEKIELWDITKDADGVRPQTDPSQPPGVSSDGAQQPKARKAMLKSTKGTYQFLPPEALSGDEFDGFKADIWSIGVTLYALLFGYLPFFSTDLVTLFEKIESDAVVFPTTCQDEEAKDLLLRILEKDPEKRISIEQILEHTWLHRHVDSKALTQQVRALKRAPALCVDTNELGGAVSVLQSRFDQISRAVRDSSLAELQINGGDPAPPGGNDGAAHVATSYTPRPVATAEVLLPPWMELDLSVLATQLHYDWCRAKHLEGWVHGASRDDASRVHPLLTPMWELPEDARLKNVQCVEETLKCVLALGCHVAKRKSSLPAPKCPPGLLLADHVTLAWDMIMLVDLLAENSHEVWASNYVAQGWRLADTFDAEAKTHPSLKPYMTLDEAEKNLCREGVGAVLKSCVCLGYEFSCARDYLRHSTRAARLRVRCEPTA